MNWRPNTISLITRGRYDEAVSTAALYPGMVLQPDGSGSITFHSVVGGGGELMVAQENALIGGDITQTLPAGRTTPFRRPAKGDKMNMLLQLGQSVTAGDELMSAGDGTLTINLGEDIHVNTAASSNITNASTFTTFSNGSYTFPANSLKVGDLLHITAKATVTGQNSTNTHTVQVLLGSDTLANSGALLLAPNDIVNLNMYVTVRTIGNSTVGTITGSGTLFGGTPGTSTTTFNVNLASTNLDTTVAEILAVQAKASAASTGNIIRLDQFSIANEAVGGLETLVIADEDIDNSSSSSISVGAGSDSAAFIRCIVV